MADKKTIKVIKFEIIQCDDPRIFHLFKSAFDMNRKYPKRHEWDEPKRVFDKWLSVDIGAKERVELYCRAYPFCEIDETVKPLAVNLLRMNWHKMRDYIGGFALDFRQETAIVHYQ